MESQRQQAVTQGHHGLVRSRKRGKTIQSDELIYDRNAEVEGAWSEGKNGLQYTRLKMTEYQIKNPEQHLTLYAKLEINNRDHVKAKTMS